MTDSVAPSPSTRPGFISLQPSYFTSSLYVNALREDIDALVKAFQEQYETDSQAKAFPLFKNIWKNHGWPWLHFKIFDYRSREKFLEVTLRLFVERTRKSETPVMRSLGLFGLYTFFYTQPTSATPRLWTVSHVPVPLDILAELLAMPSELGDDRLREPVEYILDTLVKAQVFYILPSSEHGTQSPRELPREVVIADGLNDVVTQEGMKKKGRPSKQARIKKARDAAANLEKWMVTGVGVVGGTTSSRDRYESEKGAMVEELEKTSEGREAIERASQRVLERVRRVDALAAEQGLEVGGEGGERTGLARLEAAASSSVSSGLLGLMSGAGNDLP
ncbi:hypothetical protein HGRIS_008108 [Hohenbuehelia grisea]|uniref:Transposase n=1 Tax=Hohenbuehelia grisea TaxID=104357 RepID=A0ABR3J7Q7_9AGAR